MYTIVVFILVNLWQDLRYQTTESINTFKTFVTKLQSQSTHSRPSLPNYRVNQHIHNCVRHRRLAKLAPLYPHMVIAHDNARRGGR